MPLQILDMEDATLGKFLQGIRDSQGLDLWTIADETKISLKNLQAIEDNDFNALPAEAFTRGMYTLYARALSLDPGPVLRKYSHERPPRKLALDCIEGRGGQIHDVGLMAERPSSLHFTTFGMALFCLLLAGGFSCWYFSWNPATYLSQQLRSLENPSPQTEQATSPHMLPAVPDPLSYFRTPAGKHSQSYDLFTLPTPTSATAGVAPVKTPVSTAADSTPKNPR